MPVYPYMDVEQRKVLVMPMCRGTVAAIPCPGGMQARKSGCATTDQRLRSTTAPGASAIHEERKKVRFDNRSCFETSAVETGNHVTRTTPNVLRMARDGWSDDDQNQVRPPDTRR